MGKNPDRNAYFGEEPIHTSWSDDLFGSGTDVVGNQKALDNHAEKSVSEGSREDNKTDVERIHSDWVVTSEGILTGKTGHHMKIRGGFGGGFRR